MTDQPAAPTNSAEAGTRLAERMADKAWGEKVLSGDVEATQEFKSLSAMKAGGSSDVDAALSGALPDVPDGDLRFMANTAGMLREIGLSEDIVREALEGKGVSQAELNAVNIWKSQRMRDPEFTKKYLAADPEAHRLMTTANVVIANGLKTEAA